MVYLLDSTYVVVMILVALLVFVLVAYLIVRMFAQNSKKTMKWSLSQVVNPRPGERC